MIRQYTLPLPHREAMAADDFMVTDSNREATGWIDQWPSWIVPCIIVHGPAGCGKTHLVQVWLTRSHGTAVTPEDIATADLGLLADKKCVALDNADAVAGDRAREEALFHLYNRLCEKRGYLLLTAARPPQQWEIGLPDLRSRLLSMPSIAVTAPDDDLLAALLIKQFRDRQIDISMDLIDYLLPRITRSPEAIREMVATLDRVSLSEGRGITVALVRRIMESRQDFLIS